MSGGDRDIYGNETNRDIHGNRDDRDIHGNIPRDIHGNEWPNRPSITPPADSQDNVSRGSSGRRSSSEGGDGGGGGTFPFPSWPGQRTSGGGTSTTSSGWPNAPVPHVEERTSFLQEFAALIVLSALLHFSTPWLSQWVPAWGIVLMWVVIGIAFIVWLIKRLWWLFLIAGALYVAFWFGTKQQTPQQAAPTPAQAVGQPSVRPATPTRTSEPAAKTTASEQATPADEETASANTEESTIDESFDSTTPSLEEPVADEPIINSTQP